MTLGNATGGWVQQAIPIASGKTKLGLVVGFDRLTATDVVALGNLSITASNPAKLTVANVAIGTASRVINGTTYLAGQWAQYDLTAAVIAVAVESYALTVDWTSDAGEGSIDEIAVDIKASLEAQYETLQAALAAAGLVSNVLPVEIATTPGSPIGVGVFHVDSSAGAFSIELSDGAGVRLFCDSSGSTALNPVTIGTASQQFNGLNGAFEFSGQLAIVINLGVANQYYVIEV